MSVRGSAGLQEPSPDVPNHARSWLQPNASPALLRWALVIPAISWNGRCEPRGKHTWACSRHSSTSTDRSAEDWKIASPTSSIRCKTTPHTSLKYARSSRPIPRARPARACSRRAASIGRSSFAAAGSTSMSASTSRTAHAVMKSMTTSSYNRWKIQSPTTLMRFSRSLYSST